MPEESKNESAQPAGEKVVTEHEVQELFLLLDLGSTDQQQYFDRLRELTEPKPRPVFVQLTHSTAYSK